MRPSSPPQPHRRIFLPARLVRWAVGAALGVALSAAAQLSVSILNPAPASFTLGWPDLGLTNAYTVQYREALGDAPWLNAPHTAPWPVTEPLWTDPRTDPAPTRFYRVLAVERPYRGELVASESLGELTAMEINMLMALADIPLVVSHGAELFKLNYETIDPRGGRFPASGLLAIPLGVSGDLPLVSYQHGTLVLTNEAPSAQLLGEAFVGIAMAGSGYVAVLPDYLGLGDSPPLHPYVHARSEASAAVDMLRAARTFCASNEVPLSGKLFLVGYSQGGHATMALHREIESYHADEFTITASAPMAGPYDLSGTSLDDLYSGRPRPNPYYYAFLLAAYQDIYRFAPSFADLLTPPYDTILPPMMNGNFSGAELNAVLPADPLLIAKPEVRDAVRDRPDHPFRIALRDNDVHAWRPVAPLRLYHCGGDEDVPITHSHVAFNTMVSLGVTNVAFHITSPVLGHGDCAVPSLLHAKEWFDSLK